MKRIVLLLSVVIAATILPVAPASASHGPNVGPRWEIQMQSVACRNVPFLVRYKAITRFTTTAELRVNYSDGNGNQDHLMSTNDRVTTSHDPVNLGNLTVTFHAIAPSNGDPIVPATSRNVTVIQCDDVLPSPFIRRVQDDTETTVAMVEVEAPRLQTAPYTVAVDWGDGTVNHVGVIPMNDCPAGPDMCDPNPNYVFGLDHVYASAGAIDNGLTVNQWAVSAVSYTANAVAPAAQPAYVMHIC